MEFREFLSGNEEEAWQMLEAMHAPDGAFLRLDGDGRIITQTQRAEELLGQKPLRSVYEVLGELPVRTIQIAIARREMMCTRDVVDGIRVRITICPGDDTHLLYLEQEQEPRHSLRDQIVEQRLRTALSVLALNQPDAQERAVLHISRLLHELELLDGRVQGLRSAERVELGLLCAEVVEFTQRYTKILIKQQGSYTPVVCNADEIRIALYHLLTNAVQAQGVHHITVRWGSIPGSAFFEVTDDGETLSEDAFSVLCTTHRRMGTVTGILPAVEGHIAGLGLPTVCEIAMRHGGGVSLVSAPEGKTIRVTIVDDLEACSHNLHAPCFSDGYTLQETELSVLQ